MSDIPFLSMEGKRVGRVCCVWCALSSLIIEHGTNKDKTTPRLQKGKIAPPKKVTRGTAAATAKRSLSE